MDNDSYLPFLEEGAFAPQELIFVDGSVQDYQSLVTEIAEAQEVIVLDPQEDGVEQITQALIGRSNISGIHILSHGDSGSLDLGTAELSQGTLEKYGSDLETWADALTNGSDILWYGCNVAEDELGQAFLQEVSQRTGADIAASDDLTGSSQLGGDWELEYAIGEIETESLSGDSYQYILHDGHNHDTFALRINPGTSSSYTDVSNQLWEPDNYSSGGKRYGKSVSIAATEDDTLYHSERYGSNFSYNIPVENGSYNVKLHFAEIFFTEAGKRVFDVAAEGALTIDNLDIYAEAGASTALIRTIPVNVSDGTLNLGFLAEVNNAKISAIEIIAGEPENQSPTTSGIGNVNVTEGTTSSVVNLFDAFADAEDTDNQLTYTIDSNSNPSLFSSTDINTTTGELTVAYASGQIGTAQLSVTATDTGGLTVSTSFDVTVAVDGAPTTSGISNVNVTEGTTSSVVSLFNAFADAEDADSELVYTIDSNSNPNLFSSTNIDPTTGELTLAYASGQTGTAQLSVTATDTGGLTVSTSFDVTVAANSAPTTSGISNVNVTEGTTSSVVSLFNAFADAEDADSELVYTIDSNSNPNLFSSTNIDPTTGELTLAYASGQTGTAQLTVIATDTQGLSVSTSFDASVTANNSNPNPEAVRINVGTSSSYTDVLNQTWMSDTYSSGGKRFGETVSIANTQDDTLYQSERYGSNFSYNIPVENGSYNVNLHFAEIFFSASGERVFDITAEGALAIDNLDIYGQVGANTALIRTIPVSVSDGVLNLGFLAEVNNAKVSAIEIIPGEAGNQAPTTTAISNITVPQGTESSTVELFAAFEDDTDADEQLTYEVISNTNAGLFDAVSIDPATGQLTLDYGTDSLGSAEVTVRATDTEGASASTAFTVSVVDLSTPVASLIAPTLTEQSQEYLFTVTYTGQTTIDTSTIDNSDLQVTGPDGFNQAATFESFATANGGAEVTATYSLQAPPPQGIWYDGNTGTYTVTLNSNEVSDTNNKFVTSGSLGTFLINIPHFLHVVIDAPAWAVDYDGNGSELVEFLGAESHTHESGGSLVGFTWKNGETIIGTRLILKHL